mmetsp:Transcript_5786/g.19683  ORF Transcript_5786/g.19683 Transcript_5786/m.19683 type:complete len:206 (-) Transcript_5786:65-682(-)
MPESGCLGTSKKGTIFGCSGLAGRSGKGAPFAVPTGSPPAAHAAIARWVSAHLTRGSGALSTRSPHSTRDAGSGMASALQSNSMRLRRMSSAYLCLGQSIDMWDCPPAFALAPSAVPTAAVTPREPPGAHGLVMRDLATVARPGPRREAARLGGAGGHAVARGHIARMRHAVLIILVNVERCHLEVGDVALRPLRGVRGVGGCRV